MPAAVLVPGERQPAETRSWVPGCLSTGCRLSVPVLLATERGAEEPWESARESAAAFRSCLQLPVCPLSLPAWPLPSLPVQPPPPPTTTPSLSQTSGHSPLAREFAFLQRGRTNRFVSPREPPLGQCGMRSEHGVSAEGRAGFPGFPQMVPLHLALQGAWLGAP